jgi:hypothetical protein
MARQWMSRLQEHIDSFRELQRAAAQADEESPTPLTTQVDTSVNATVNATLTEAEAQSLEHGSLLHPPKGWGRRALYGVSLPLLLCFAATVPDVRQPRWKRCFPVTLFMAVVWLAVLAELMMRRCVAGQPTAHATAPVAWLTLPRLDCSAEDVACLLDIPGDVMGLTITAGGTSLPNLFASVIVAQQVSAPPPPAVASSTVPDCIEADEHGPTTPPTQGLGNMAVSNAFGSNTFNVFVALGEPVKPLLPVFVQTPPWRAPRPVCTHVLSMSVGAGHHVHSASVARGRPRHRRRSRLPGASRQALHLLPGPRWRARLLPGDPPPPQARKRDAAMRTEYAGLWQHWSNAASGRPPLRQGCVGMTRGRLTPLLGVCFLLVYALFIGWLVTL